MKTIKYIGALLLFLIINACNNDDDTNGLRIVYEENFIETFFLEAGETLPPAVNWSGERGIFSATTLPNTAPDDLFNRSNLSIDEQTGVLSWDRSIPLGETEIFITASNSIESTTVIVTIKNTFIEGLFYGGFNNDVNDNSNASFDSGSINFTKEGTAGLLGINDGDIFSMEGTWTIDESIMTVNFDTDNRVLKGYMNGRSGEPAATFTGQWGEGLDQNNTIENLRGLFRFTQ
ncbi:hypothetical protein [uncultured Aquimarina sp.]|uniref:hypothetical protein n=1 Tax=uncultured Aquimarina sp. TaxID=575652 RepID=UPI00261005A7|nr:hypothetical protein [uncultured Aquimarina sp.]